MKSFINFGIRPEYEPWEVFLVRKINVISLIGGFNVGLSALLLPLLGIHQFQAEMLTMVCITPLVFLLNRYAGYTAAAYAVYVPGAILMYFLTVKMGIESYIVVFFFPLVLSIVQLLGRAEMLKHMMILLGIYLACILAISITFQNGYFGATYPAEAFKNLRVYIIVLSMTTSIGFFAIVTYESIRQENRIKRMLNEKEVLLAEVYHRVKNNMSIVTSLLNLKKNMSDSEDVKEALEACRSRVYSMSLVHEKFFAQNSPTGIDFTQYAKDLIVAVTDSFGGTDVVEVQIAADELFLDVTQAIPCGLILNELLTNSFKHAGPHTNRLIIKIQLSGKEGYAEIEYGDNGPGFDPKQEARQGSMGLELIHSLCDQLDASCDYEQHREYQFRFRFKPKRK
ncbi:MAG: sensor histidine kinase [Bacteroidetes bacterium]|nr:sensor histidine kinase [Bacteroidota bacterium]